GWATTSVRVPRWVTASSENFSAMVAQMSQSVRDCHGVEMAGLNVLTNGCMSVVDRSCFSYQVAAGSTTSLCSVEVVILKSNVSNRSILPIGASSRHVTSRGRRSSGVSSALTVLSTPSRCLRKYCSPLADEPNVLARHIDQMRG